MDSYISFVHGLMAGLGNVDHFEVLKPIISILTQKQNIDIGTLLPLVSSYRENILFACYLVGSYYAQEQLSHTCTKVQNIVSQHYRVAVTEKYY